MNESKKYDCSRGCTVERAENGELECGYRQGCCKLEVYASNLTPQELRDRLGDRLYSRIVNLSTDIELFGSDKRGISK